MLPAKSPAGLAEQASRAFFDSAPVVIVAAESEELRAASAAAALGVPVLLDGPQVAGEVDRLGAEVALTVGPVADPGIDVVVPKDDAALAEAIGADGAGTPVSDGGHAAALAGLDAGSPTLLVPGGEGESPSATGTGTASSHAPAGASGTTPADANGAAPTTAPASTPATAPEPLESDRDELPATKRPKATTGLAVMTTGTDRDTAALGTALAAGARVLVVAGGDPRATSDAVKAIGAADPKAVVGIGPEFVDAKTLAWRTRVAATGVELPGGGQLVLPGKTYVALYGNPTTSALGVLGEQGPKATIERAAEHAAPYEALADGPVVPALEIIATVASSAAGPDGNYSNEAAIEDLLPLVDLAGKHGQYVVLDLQPGRTDFVTQAKLYQKLLERPYVGLALDPEWRLGPGEVHMRQIGHVDVAEVNKVVDWLADLTRKHDLPQKLLVLHQFQVRMIPGVDKVDQSRSELAVLIHADGQGAQGSKQDTWRVLHDNAPSVHYWGWKNFYDEDLPGPLNPEQTMQVRPTPDFISYQ